MEVDKSKNISQMTIQELNALNLRLRREREVENCILDLLRNSGKKWDYDDPPKIDTTTPIGQLYPTESEIQTKSISQMTMAELSQLLDRLRLEGETHSLIYDLKRNSGERWSWEDRPVVDNVTPVDQLYHHGVPGMKWGVRKARSGYIKPRATLSRRDREEQDFLDNPTKVYDKVYKKAASGIRKGTRLLNNSPKYKGQNFKVDSPLRREYYKDYSDMVTQQLNAAATSKSNPFSMRRIGMSPHKTLQMKLSFDYTKELRASYDIAKADTSAGQKEARKLATLATKGGSAVKTALDKLDKLVKHDDMYHEEDDLEEMTIDLLVDADGYITGIDEQIEPSEELSQDAMDAVNDFLEHHGVLGMKWGVRRDRKDTQSRSAPTKSGGETTTKPPVPKADDFLESRQFKSKAVSGLSTAELKKLNDRLNLEKQYKDLTKDEREKGKSFLSESVSSGLKQTATTVVAAGSLWATKKAIEKLFGAETAAEIFPKDKKKS